jgi:hypothetical protein
LREKICRCFIDTEKAFHSFKEKPCGSNETKRNVIKLYQGINFCVKHRVVEVTDFVEQYKRVRQGYSLQPYLFNIFSDNITEYISEDNLHAPVTGTMTIPGLLFADNLAIPSFTVNGLQRVINQVIIKHCNDRT